MELIAAACNNSASEGCGGGAGAVACGAATAVVGAGLAWPVPDWAGGSSEAISTASLSGWPSSTPAGAVGAFAGIGAWAVDGLAGVDAGTM
ncbi:MAG: hypothetical protein IPM03_05080 [Sulfuritalea sp.]|nr:hypothetical protein [Sulfuritalea sp.]